jgi:hypothetical protein
MLRGLEKLAGEAAPAKEESRRLDPVTIGAGEVEVSLNIDLPAGYKLNAEAPQLLRFQVNGVPASHSFTAAETPRFKVNVEKDAELDLNLTLYYCEVGDQRLCMIHDARLILPLTVGEAGQTSVEAGYIVNLS